MDCRLALWPLLLLVSLVTFKVWSFDLYLKKLPCNTVYIFTQSSVKYPCSTRVPMCFFLSLSLSLFLADSLECGRLVSSFSCSGFQDLSRLLERAPCAYVSSTSSVQGFIGFLCNSGNISLFFSFFHFLIVDSRFWSIKGPQHYTVSFH